MVEIAVHFRHYPTLGRGPSEDMGRTRFASPAGAHAELEATTGTCRSELLFYLPPVPAPEVCGSPVPKTALQ